MTESHDLRQRIFALLIMGYGRDSVELNHGLNSRRRIDIYAEGDPSLVIECETRLGALDAAQGQLRESAAETGARPVLVVSDDMDLPPDRRARIETSVDVFSESELRSRLTE